jgi:hypothetical protein
MERAVFRQKYENITKVHKFMRMRIAKRGCLRMETMKMRGVER